jgi:cellulose synthase/poly-beta-1,6-N-acetylglucosamine synthase-like glycosyltransferase
LPPFGERASYYVRRGTAWAVSSFVVSAAFAVAVAEIYMKTKSGRPQRKPRAIVAIPAKDEAERLPACIAGLGAQVGWRNKAPDAEAFAVAIIANNCTDETIKIARRAGAEIRFEVRVEEAILPAALAHAGGARRYALDFADAWLRGLGIEDGLLLSTDADSQVAPDWIAATFEAFARGADAVLGQISLDAEGELLPAALHARGRFEATYERLLTEVSARLDPLECNPWPHHSTISGASLAITQQMYRRIGGLPSVPLGEDKALVAALRRHDAEIRFSPEVCVVTSGRTQGRAPGGVADALRLRSDQPETPCDEALEPCAIAYTRALWRGRLRRSGFSQTMNWATDLRVPDDAVNQVLAAPTFGAAWERLEKASVALIPQRLSPRDLPHEIEIARRMLSEIWTDQDIKPIFRSPIGAEDFDEAV